MPVREKAAPWSRPGPSAYRSVFCDRVVPMKTLTLWRNRRRQDTSGHVVACGAARASRVSPTEVICLVYQTRVGNERLLRGADGRVVFKRQQGHLVQREPSPIFHVCLLVY